MYDEFDVVKLRHEVSSETRDFWPGIGGDRIPEGSVGAIVAVYGTQTSNIAYEVEFVAEDGTTYGLVTLKDSDIVPA